MTDLLAVLCVAVPLVAAIATLLARRGRGLLAFAALLAAALAAAGLARELLRLGPATVAMGGWSAPLGIHWRVDGLAVTLLLTTAVVAAAVCVHAGGYFRAAGGGAGRYFWPLTLLLVAALNAAFLSNDLFHWYVTLELISLSAVPLVTLAGTAPARRAAEQYLYASLGASLAYLMGVALVYAQFGTLDIALLAAADPQGPAFLAAVALMLSGLLMKSAVFPLHGWLPGAHGSAPPPVSALLSALVVKGALYIALRLWFELLPAIRVLDLLMAGFGVAAIFFGSYQALRTPRLKLLVAWSTVAQLGYLALVFPLAGNPAGRELAFLGGAYFIVSHACAKAAMFLAAGNLQLYAGHDRLEDLGAAARALPLSLFAYGLAAVSILGLPPSGGFLAKWTLLNAAIAGGLWPLIVVIVAGSLMAAAYAWRLLELGFATPAATPPTPKRAVARRSEWACLLLAGLSLALGLNALPVLGLGAIRIAGIAL